MRCFVLVYLPRYIPKAIQLQIGIARQICLSSYKDAQNLTCLGMLQINESNLKKSWFGSDVFPFPGGSYSQVPVANLLGCIYLEVYL